MRENHQIEGLMLTAMSSIREMIDVNTIIGEPIEALEGLVIIPISKVSFGFAAGGSEFKGETRDDSQDNSEGKNNEEKLSRFPFGGGAGAGASINPIAFLVVQNENVRLIPMEHASSFDRLLDYVPDLIEKTNSFINKKMQNNNEKTDKIINQMKNTSRNTDDITDETAEMYEPAPESDGEDF